MSTMLMPAVHAAVQRPQPTHQAAGVHPVLEGLAAIDQDDRHLLAVEAGQGRILVHVSDFQQERHLAARLLDRGEGLVAEAAVGPGEHDDPGP